MPLVDDVISQLEKSTWFTALDLQSGFWQIRMAPKDVKKTALITKTGLYDWTVMPFGLKNATNTFTWTMSTIFKEFGDKFLKIFVDDLNVHSEDWAEHLQHLDTVFFKLREVNLKLNPNKCCFAAKSIIFLDHVVSHEETKLDCRNPSFGLATKAKGITRVRAKGKPESQGKRKPGSHITYSRECKKVLGSVRKC
jgi:hypothetical protein